jgi:hypothetical protein
MSALQPTTIAIGSITPCAATIQTDIIAVAFYFERSARSQSRYGNVKIVRRTRARLQSVSRRTSSSGAEIKAFALRDFTSKSSDL